MSIIREHFEQIWNNKDVSGIERFIARDYNASRSVRCDNRNG